MGLFRTLGRGWVAYQTIGLFLMSAAFVVLALLSFSNGNNGPAVMLIVLALIFGYIALRLKRALDNKG